MQTEPGTGPGGAPRADDPALADGAAELRAFYVHIPFCHRVCPYCDFAVVAGRDDLVERYVAVLVTEIETTAPFDAPIDSIAIGGGTPSRLRPDQLRRIVESIRATHGLAGDAEVSLEANPEDWTPALASDLAAAGFTRVSLGAQSFDPAVLSSLGRAHRPSDSEHAVAAARGAGFRSVNLDLIFGTPGESPASWATSVERALATGVDHLSCYALTVERGTALSRAVAAGAPAPDPDRQADDYETAAAMAAAAGLTRYETSNAAAPGHACRYNLITWAGGEYLGAGNGAHRHRSGVRSWNVRRLERYVEAVESGESPVSGDERLEGWAASQDRMILGLRRTAGVAVGPPTDALLASEWGRRLAEAGVVGVDGGRLRVIRPLLGDEVARAVLAVDGPDC